MKFTGKNTVGLVLLVGLASSLCAAQTTKPTLESYVAQSVREAGTLPGVTIEQWSHHHPGELVGALWDSDSDYDPANAYKLDAREQQNRKLEERWCLRSIAEVDLAGGIHVRRIALFYQPLVESLYGNTLPPLPAETGEKLRNHGCRLVRILHEFDGASGSGALDSHSLQEISAQLPGKRSNEPGKLVEFARDAYWTPVCSFEKFGKPVAYHYLFAHNSASPKAATPAVLLEWQWGTLDYGSPSSQIIHPLAGQPWLAVRAAARAGLPQGTTLDMLSFLSPVGDTSEKPPFYCEKQLIPVLRTWINLAAQSKPQEQAAALLLADRVLGRLGECAEFANNGDLSAEQEALAEKDHDALENDLQSLGIKTELSARVGNEHYSGNLLEKVFRLAPDGPVNELARVAVLDDRCQWSGSSDSADCGDIIKKGEAFLSRFPQDEWTPSVNLILAEAYALTAANPAEETSPSPQGNRTDWERKAALQYRAWYAGSTNNRDRLLIWQEIWGLDAGLGPWLLTPFQRE